MGTERVLLLEMKKEAVSTGVGEALSFGGGEAASIDKVDSS